MGCVRTFPGWPWSKGRLAAASRAPLCPFPARQVSPHTQHVSTEKRLKRACHFQTGNPGLRAEVLVVMTRGWLESWDVLTCNKASLCLLSHLRVSVVACGPGRAVFCGLGQGVKLLQDSRSPVTGGRREGCHLMAGVTPVFGTKLVLTHCPHFLHWPPMPTQPSTFLPQLWGPSLPGPLRPHFAA